MSFPVTLGFKTICSNTIKQLLTVSATSSIKCLIFDNRTRITDTYTLFEHIGEGGVNQSVY